MKYKVGDSVKLKDGRTGIVEDYDEKFIYIKDNYGRSLKKSYVNDRPSSMLGKNEIEKTYLLTKEEAEQVRADIDNMYEKNGVEIKCEVVGEENVDGITYEKIKVFMGYKNADWQMVGTILPFINPETGKLENMISEGVPEYYKTAVAKCDECDVRRKAGGIGGYAGKRTYTIVVKCLRDLTDKYGNDVKKGEYRQLGTECIQKYTGLNAENTTEFANLLNQLENEDKTKIVTQIMRSSSSEYSSEKRNLKLVSLIKLCLIKYIKTHDYNFNINSKKEILSYLRNLDDLYQYKVDKDAITKWIDSLEDNERPEYASLWMKTESRDGVVEIPSNDEYKYASIIRAYYRYVKENEDNANYADLNKRLRLYCIYAAKNGKPIREVLEQKPDVSNLNTEYDEITSSKFSGDDRISKLWKTAELDEDDIIYFNQFIKAMNNGKIADEYKTINIIDVENAIRFYYYNSKLGYSEYLTARESLDIVDELLVVVEDENAKKYLTIISKEIPSGKKRIKLLEKVRINNEIYQLVEIQGGESISSVSEVKEIIKEEKKEIKETIEKQNQDNKQTSKEEMIEEQNQNNKYIPKKETEEDRFWAFDSIKKKGNK